LVIMSSIAEPHNDGFHVVVAEDGSVRAADLAALGVRPGAHLRVVPEHEEVPQRRSARGMLAGAIPPEVVEDFIRGLDEAKEERRAFYTAQ
jgi:hypothetical protein